MLNINSDTNRPNFRAADEETSVSKTFPQCQLLSAELS